MTAPPSRDNTASLRDPKGTYFAKIEAAGEGCRPNPDGSRSWEASISPDGKTFTITFSNYEVKLDAEQTRNRLDRGCMLSITLDTPGGYSYALTELSYQGYAFLEPGTTGSIEAYYTWQGQTVGVSGSIDTEKRQIYRGPMDEGYLFQHSLLTTDAVWSSCGTKRLLNVETTIEATRSNRAQSAYLNVASIDGRTAGKLILTLNPRPCTAR